MLLWIIILCCTCTVGDSWHKVHTAKCREVCSIGELSISSVLISQQSSFSVAASTELKRYWMIRTKTIKAKGKTMHQWRKHEFHISFEVLFDWNIPYSIQSFCLSSCEFCAVYFTVNHIIFVISLFNQIKIDLFPLCFLFQWFIWFAGKCLNREKRYVIVLVPYALSPTLPLL